MKATATFMRDKFLFIHKFVIIISSYHSLDRLFHHARDHTSHRHLAVRDRTTLRRLRVVATGGGEVILHEVSDPNHNLVPLERKTSTGQISIEVPCFSPMQAEHPRSGGARSWG